MLRNKFINRLVVLVFLAVSQASNKVSSLDPCFNSCKFACDVQVQQCICLRGYEIEGDRCQGTHFITVTVIRQLQCGKSFDSWISELRAKSSVRSVAVLVVAVLVAVIVNLKFNIL